MATALVVVSATLEKQKLSLPPVSVQVIDQTQMPKMGTDMVAQALEEAFRLGLDTSSGRVVEPSIRGTG